jgi:hypothetical protein
MSERDDDTVVSSYGLKSKLQNAFISADFAVGVAGGTATAWAAWSYPKMLDNAGTVLITEAVLGAGVLGVVLAALAVLVTFFDDHYRRILTAVPGGVPGALFPYRITAGVGACAALLAGGVLLAWPELSAHTKAVTFGIATGFTAWAIVGTYQLVTLTLFHGVKRADLLAALDEGRKLLEQRRRRPA